MNKLFQNMLFILGTCIMTIGPTPVLAKAKVIVIGAGVAGLACAQQLQKANHEVVILEAQNRLGGRVHTNRNLSVPVELGAQWIHGSKGNPLTTLVKKQGPTRTTNMDDMRVYNRRGGRLTDDQLDFADELYNSFYYFLEEFRDESRRDRSLGQIMHQFIKYKNLSAQEKNLFQLIGQSYIEAEYAANVDKLSAQYFDSDNDMSGDDIISLQGHDKWIKAMSQSLTIHRNQVARRIENHDGYVSVITQKQSFTADFVVVTLPIGVLQSKVVSFTPSLTREKQRAIQQLGVGLYNKVFLEFPRVFWSGDPEFVYVLPDPNPYPMLYNLYNSYQKPIMAFYAVGKQAQQWEKSTDSAIVVQLMKLLRSIYTKNIPNPKKYIVTRWQKNPYAKGSYSYLPVNTKPQVYRQLAKPQGRLFFAGEATNSRYPGTMHGAYLSGLRAAAEIEKLL